MSTLLHLGALPENADQVVYALRRSGLKGVEILGDSWFQWGEDREADDEPLHVTATIPWGSRISLPLILHDLHRQRLLAPDRIGDVLAATTSPSDDSEGVINWRTSISGNFDAPFVPRFY